MAKLIFMGGKFSGRVYEFAVEKTTVGRGDHNTLTIQDSSVPHSHCEILVNGTEVIVRDLGSSNGTFVNGVRLHDQQRPLLARQIVKFGSVEARVELESSSAPDTDTVADVTAVYSHARHTRQTEGESKPTDAVPVSPKAGRPSPPCDQTLIMPRPRQAAEKAAPPPEAIEQNGWTMPRKTGIAVVVAAVVTGFVVICWLILVKGR